MNQAQAQTARRAAVRWRNGFLAATVVGVVSVVAGCFLHPVVPVAVLWLLIGGGLALAGAGALRARAVTAAMRYRVTTGPVQLAIAVTLLGGGAAVVAWLYGIQVWTPPGGGSAVSTVVGALLPAVLLVQLAIVLNARSLIDGDAEGMRFIMRGMQWRRTRVPWADIEAVVVSSCARPDRVEIAVRTRPAAAPAPFALPGVAAPVDRRHRIVVARNRVSLDGLGAMMNRSGRDDIALLAHTPDGIAVLGYANAWARSIARYPGPAPDPAVI